MLAIGLVSENVQSFDFMATRLRNTHIDTDSPANHQKLLNIITIISDKYRFESESSDLQLDTRLCYLSASTITHNTSL